jgi:hypothetical protein
MDVMPLVFQQKYSMSVTRIDECEIAWRSLILKDGVAYQHDHRDGCRKLPHEKRRQYPTLVGHWPDVVMLIEEGHNYAHWQFDKMPAVIGMGKAIIKKSYFVAFEPIKFVLESLKWLGFEDRIIYIKKDQRIRVDRIWTVEPYPFYLSIPPLIKRWRKLVAGLAKIDLKPPTRFGFQNRAVGDRVITNFSETVTAVREKWPNYNWEILPNGWNSIIPAAQTLNTLRFYFGPHGANLVNTIYMQPFSVVCEAQKRVFGTCYMFTSLVFRLRHVYCVMGKGSGRFCIPYETSIGMVRAALALIHESD